MGDFRKYLDEKLKEPEFAAEWERLQPELEIMRTLIKARAENNLTQKQLAEKTGIRQSNISRIENGTCSPTISTLQTLAEGMGKHLHIEFR